MAFIRNAASRRPVLFVLVSFVLLFVAMSGAAALASVVLGVRTLDTEAQIAGQAAGAALCVLLLWRLGWLGAAGIPRENSSVAWFLTLLVLIYSSIAGLLSFFGTLQLPGPAPAGSALTLVHASMAGVMEELLFRGVVLLPLIVAWEGRRGRVAAALVSAAAFALIHLVNAIGGDLNSTLLQTAEAFLSAVLYAALVLRSGSIWPAILLHSALNLLVNRYAVADPDFVGAASGYVILVLSDIPLAALGLYLLGREPNRNLALDVST